MILFSALALIALAVVLPIISTIQQLYLESQRLRTRDVPMQQFFRATLEDRFGFSIDRGSLAFSLINTVGCCFPECWFSPSLLRTAA